MPTDRLGPHGPVGSVALIGETELPPRRTRFSKTRIEYFWLCVSFPRWWPLA